MDRIFLDYNSTTPVDPEIFQKIKRLNTELYGNPASINHTFGRESKKLIDNSRIELASGIGCNTDEIIFTSGATESLNMAIKGIVTASKKNKKHIITQTDTHRSDTQTDTHRSDTYTTHTQTDTQTDTHRSDTLTISYYNHYMSCCIASLKYFGINLSVLHSYLNIITLSSRTLRKLFDFRN